MACVCVISFFCLRSCGVLCLSTGVMVTVSRIACFSSQRNTQLRLVAETDYTAEA